MSRLGSNIIQRRFVLRLAAEQDNLCFYCGYLMLLPSRNAAIHYTNSERNCPDTASIDHIRLKSQGGGNGFNIVIAHRKCNTDRNKRPLNLAELQKLATLNTRREHLFSPEHGHINPASFGIISNASVALAHILDNTTQGDYKHSICQLLQRFNKSIKALDPIKSQRVWNLCSKMFYTAAIDEAKNIGGDGETHARSIMHAILSERRRQRNAPLAQLVEAGALNALKSRFESGEGYKEDK